MTKPARGRPNLRSHLLTSARELLREEGPSALTARSVARRAGVADATVFNNFGDLRGLLLSLGQEGFPEYDAVIEFIAQGPGDSVHDWLVDVFDLNRIYHVVTLPLSVQQLATLSPIREEEPRIATSVSHTLSNKLLGLQQEGRVSEKVDTSAAAMLLVAGGAHAALTEFTTGATSVLGSDPKELALRIVAQLALT